MNVNFCRTILFQKMLFWISDFTYSSITLHTVFFVRFYSNEMLSNRN